MQNIIFDSQLIKKYDISGPRYTSYPTAPQFHEKFTQDDLISLIKNQNENQGQTKPISLYFHLPFCATICYFCGCNKVITKDRSKSAEYLKFLFKEIDLKAKHIQKTPVSQIHFGGGTPTFLSDDELVELTLKIKNHFEWDKAGEFAVETDPREVSENTLKILAELGFNRLSFGVQDFNEKVQKSVNRIQSKEITTQMVQYARENGFKSINLDLMYGLPFQNVSQFEKTLEEIINIKPNRISLFNYAHLPHLFKPQRRINEIDLPKPAIKLEMFKLALDKLQSFGYEYIGMDHFALKDDELTIAKNKKKLNRNFQGYSTYPNLDLYAFGVSAISKIGQGFSQNEKSLDEYYDRIEQNQLPVLRGYLLNKDDEIRAQVISNIMCNFELQFLDIENQFSIEFKVYFANEIEKLKYLKEDGLIELNSDCLFITAKGRILVRIVAMIFDAYLKNQSFNFSKAI